MRREPFTVGNYVHVLKRGVRKLPIVRDASDQWRFLKMLFHLNDVYRNENWERELEHEKSIFSRPESWPERRPIVSIVGYCLMPNHFHLILREINPGGVSKFMQKLGTSMNTHFNFKYKEVGSMFQGSYKLRTVSNDNYMRYLAAYVMVKNPFELFERENATFEELFEQSLKYEFCSLADYAGERNSPIIQKEILGEIFPKPEDFKKFSKDVMAGRLQKFEDVAFE